MDTVWKCENMKEVLVFPGVLMVSCGHKKHKTKTKTCPYLSEVHTEIFKVNLL